MAWSWNVSGRVDNFTFEKISPKALDTSLGSLDCLVVGGTISSSYYSDLKVTGSLEVVNARSSMADEEYLIRVWYEPELNGEKQKIEVGTFYFTADLHYENGMYKGTVNLRSLLARHTDDVTIKKWTLPKGQKCSVAFKNVFKALGGFPKIVGIKDKKFTKRVVFDVGTTPMTILQYIADYCGGEITVDTHGRTILQNYVAPSTKKNSIAHRVVADTTSVIIPGMDISNSVKEIPNRVICVFETTNGSSATQYIGKATLAAKEARSYQKIGRWITQYYNLTNVKKPYQKNLNAKAKQYLAAANHKTVYYEFNTFYQPITIGEVIQLDYDNISVKGLVTDIDLNVEIGAQMHVKIRQV